MLPVITKYKKYEKGFKMLLTAHVEIRWNFNNIRNYKSLGYTFMCIGDTFTIPVKHLPPFQRETKLLFECDY